MHKDVSIEQWWMRHEEIFVTWITQNIKKNLTWEWKITGLPKFLLVINWHHLCQLTNLCIIICIRDWAAFNSLHLYNANIYISDWAPCLSTILDQPYQMYDEEGHHQFHVCNWHARCEFKYQLHIHLNTCMWLMETTCTFQFR
jgi:hypothetical protein